jgi:hypothetical protein
MALSLLLSTANVVTVLASITTFAWARWQLEIPLQPEPEV